MLKSRSIPIASSPAARGSFFFLAFFASVGIFVPFLNVYFIQLGMTGRQVGVLSAIFPLMTLAFATPIAALADRRRWRVRVLQVAIAGLALFLFLLGYPHSFLSIMALMVVMAIFFSPVLALADSLIARMAERHGLNYGSMRLWGSIGFASSATLSGVLWGQFGYRPMFLVGSVALLPLILIAGAQEEGPQVADHARRPITDLGRDFGLVGLLLATFLVGIAIGLAIAFEGVYMNHLGGGQTLIGLLAGFSAISELPTMRYGTAIARRLRSARALLVAYGLMAGAFLAYTQVSSPWLLLPLALIKGAGFGLFYTNTIQLVNRRTPAEWSATALSLMAVGLFGLAPLIAGPLGGLVLDTVSPAAVFLGGGIAIGLGALVLAYTAARVDFA